MAKAKIPDPLERRHLVEKELPPAQALAIAEAYLAEDRCIEAVDFLRIAGAGEQLAELRERAIADGDAFLLRAVAARRAGRPRETTGRSSKPRPPHRAATVMRSRRAASSSAATTDRAAAR